MAESAKLATKAAEPQRQNSTSQARKPEPTQSIDSPLDRILFLQRNIGNQAVQRMMKSGYSIVTTADGPRGPKYEFKMGTVLMARIAGVPVIPVACAADRAWYLNRWDHFMVPKPFSRIVLAIGEPYEIPANTPLDGLEPHRLAVQQAVMSLMAESEAVLQAS